MSYSTKNRELTPPLSSRVVNRHVWLNWSEIPWDNEWKDDARFRHRFTKWAGAIARPVWKAMVLCKPVSEAYVIQVWQQSMQYVTTETEDVVPAEVGCNSRIWQPPVSSATKTSAPKELSGFSIHTMMTPSYGHIFHLMALCERNPPVTGGFPSQRLVARSLDAFFDPRLNKWLSKQSQVMWDAIELITISL